MAMFLRMKYKITAITNAIIVNTYFLLSSGLVKKNKDKGIAAAKVTVLSLDNIARKKQKVPSSNCRIFFLVAKL